MKNQKTVTVIARYTNKKTGVVSYLVRSADGKSTYCTTIINGVASGCSCPSKVKCYHKKQLEQKEQERKEVAEKFAAKSVPTWAMQLVASGKLVAPSQVKMVVQKVVSPREQVWSKDLCCLIYADNREIVDPEAHDRDVAASLNITVEQLRELKPIAEEYQQEIKPKHPVCNLPAPKVDIGAKGALNGNRGFSLLKVS